MKYSTHDFIENEETFFAISFEAEYGYTSNLPGNNWKLTFIYKNLEF